MESEQSAIAERGITRFGKEFSELNGLVLMAAEFTFAIPQEVAVFGAVRASDAGDQRVALRAWLRGAVQWHCVKLDVTLSGPSRNRWPGRGKGKVREPCLAGILLMPTPEPTPNEDAEQVAKREADEIRGH